MGCNNTVKNGSVSVILRVGEGGACPSFKVGEVLIDDDCSSPTYKNSIPDGLYLGWGGAVVIEQGRILWADDKLYDNWGEQLDGDEVLHLVGEHEPRCSKKPSG